MNPKVLNAVRQAVSQEFPEGHIVHNEGDLPDNTMYFVFSGEVGIYKRRPEGEIELVRLGPGKFFGEMALIHERPRLATARVISTTAKLAVMDRKILLKLAGSSPEFIFYLLRHAVERLLAAEDKLQRVREETQNLKSGGRSF